MTSFVIGIISNLFGLFALFNVLFTSQTKDVLVLQLFIAAVLLACGTSLMIRSWRRMKRARTEPALLLAVGRRKSESKART